MKHFILLIVALCVFTETAHAANPREELKQLTAQLQGNPNDTALREKIIKLAQTVKPAPAIPAEAERLDGRGEYAFKGAKSETDYLAAAQEFEKATSAAPWVAAYYFNAGTAYEKAQKPQEAKRNFELYLLASPEARDTREVRRRIAGLEYATEKANFPQEQARKDREEAQALLRRLDGASFRGMSHAGIDTHVAIRGSTARYIGDTGTSTVTASCTLYIERGINQCNAPAENVRGYGFFIQIDGDGSGIWVSMTSVPDDGNHGQRNFIKRVQ